MAGSSDYPELVDNKTALQDGIDYIEADNVNNAYVPINKTQTFVGANGKGASWSTDILDYLANMKAPVVTKASGSTLSVSAGAVMIKNSGQTHRIIRRNTSPVTVTASDIDTGALADDTYYYLFAVADSAATTFTVKFSLSSTAPTGLTNFELIGWFFNQSAGALDVTIDYVGNVKANGRNVPNAITRTSSTDSSTSSATLADLPETEIRFYTSGRPVLMFFHGQSGSDGINDRQCSVILRANGSDIAVSAAIVRAEQANGDTPPLATVFTHAMITLAAGVYTFVVRYNQPQAATGHMKEREYTVMEL